jgi:hypothetical protein
LDLRIILKKSSDIMRRKKDEPIIIDITPEPSPAPEGLQKIMMKYTKLAMKRLYGTDNIYVFFCDMTFSELRAIFRQSDIGPYYVGDIKLWMKEHKPSITFNCKLYQANWLAPHAWSTIAHEVTHYEEEGMKLDNNWELSHTDKFEKVFRENFQKVDDLRKQFNKEFGLDEDFIYEEDED